MPTAFRTHAARLNFQTAICRDGGDGSWYPTRLHIERLTSHLNEMLPEHSVHDIVDRTDYVALLNVTGDTLARVYYRYFDLFGDDDAPVTRFVILPWVGSQTFPIGVGTLEQTRVLRDLRALVMEDDRRRHAEEPLSAQIEVGTPTPPAAITSTRLRRYKVTLVRTQTQVVEFTADPDDMAGSDMQKAIAHAYARQDGWHTEGPGRDIRNLTSYLLDGSEGEGFTS